MLLRKDVYPYEYMDDWEKFDKKIFLKRGEFYTNLIMEKLQMQTKCIEKDFVKILK